MCSSDLREARDNGIYPPTGGFWAPYVEYVECEQISGKGEYRMYYSATKAFGSSESRIWLAVSGSPEGPFENRGVVANTWGTDDSFPNAIDPHIIDDEEGRKYLIYGSFFGGIYSKELNPMTGMSLDGNPFSLGSRIAKKPSRSPIDGPEGASMIYHPETGYYYLFLSYGWLGDDYDTRVGRSRTIQGPFLDEKGRTLDGQSLGMKMLGSYRFTAKRPYALTGTENQSADWHWGSFRGPGHGVPFYAPGTGLYYFVHHVRDGAEELCHHAQDDTEKTSYRMHYMVVRQMFFLEDWPVMAPEPYAGEPVPKFGTFRVSIQNGIPELSEDFWGDRVGMIRDALQGSWEWILFKKEDNSMQRSVSRQINVESAVMTGGKFYDYENSCECTAVCGITRDGRVIWGKRSSI